MLSNFHTHSVYCDGKNTLEEIVVAAVEKGFRAIGVSGHGYTDFDLSYCMKDIDGYIAKLNALKEKYKDKIEVYVGVEEDAFCPNDRSKFDYIIGSSHYYKVNGEYYAIDSSYEGFKKCLEVFNHDTVKMAESYYSAFCEYIQKRKPDIIGHFDLITKYDETGDSVFLKNKEYNEIAERYVERAALSGSVFEVNTGAISRGHRTAPYPSENLLYALKKSDAKLILSSDCHNADFLDCKFEETKKFLREIGFEYLYTIKNGVFVKERI